MFDPVDLGLAVSKYLSNYQPSLVPTNTFSSSECIRREPKNGNDATQ